MTTDAQGPAGTSGYPVRVNVDYVDSGRNRVTVLFRFLMAIPIVILIGGMSIFFLPVLLMILFRQKYPRWWFDFSLQYMRFSTRVGAYVWLLTDQYPSTEDEQSVHLEIDYPDATELNRWLPLFKWFLAIPHYVVLWVLYIVALVVAVVGWFIILLTGRFPRGFHNFLVGVTRWTLRVDAYVLLMATDEYPPFSLD